MPGERGPQARLLRLCCPQRVGRGRRPPRRRVAFPPAPRGCADSAAWQPSRDGALPARRHGGLLAAVVGVLLPSPSPPPPPPRSPLPTLPPPPPPRLRAASCGPVWQARPGPPPPPEPRLSNAQPRASRSQPCGCSWAPQRRILGPEQAAAASAKPQLSLPATAQRATSRPAAPGRHQGQRGQRTLARRLPVRPRQPERRKGRPWLASQPAAALAAAPPPPTRARRGPRAA
mmetsp:Transcript_7602/g.30100  ORF Transcript_7602/g.30100 Transcript_7602/m.30100 type:complete len:231 (+) Transcript_7602:430-1122(+)